MIGKSDTDENADQVARALRGALRQHHTLAALSRLALSDDLTGLCNRRGFSILAHEHMDLARRVILGGPR